MPWGGIFLNVSQIFTWTWGWTNYNFLVKVQGYFDLTLYVFVLVHTLCQECVLEQYLIHDGTILLCSSTRSSTTVSTSYLLSYLPPQLASTSRSLSECGLVKAACWEAKQKSTSFVQVHLSLQFAWCHLFHQHNFWEAQHSASAFLDSGLDAFQQWQLQQQVCVCVLIDKHAVRMGDHEKHVVYYFRFFSFVMFLEVISLFSSILNLTFSLTIDPKISFFA